jgi:archaeal flagellin FlaB
MLRKLFKQKRYFKNIYKSQKGITGLETAIILIAFVVVAAVFAYTVLSAGLFSTQKAQEAVYNGLQETQGTLRMLGGCTGVKGDANIDASIGRIDFTIALATDGTSIDLTSAYQYTYNGTSDMGTLAVDVAGANRLQIAYNDHTITRSDMAWTKTFIGKENGDEMLDPGEKAVITVWLHGETDGVWADNGATPANFIGAGRVDTYHLFTLEVKPVSGATLTIQRTTPAVLDSIVDLH